MSGFEVEVADISKHAVSVDDIRGEVAQAAQAGATVDLDGGAFGLMCGFLVGSVKSSDQSTCTALTSVTTALASTATDLEAMARDYRRSDEAAAERMADLMKAMDR